MYIHFQFTYLVVASAGYRCVHNFVIQRCMFNAFHDTYAKPGRLILIFALL